MRSSNERRLGDEMRQGEAKGRKGGVLKMCQCGELKGYEMRNEKLETN